MRTPKSRSIRPGTATTRQHRRSVRWASIGSLLAGLVATAFSLFALGGAAAVSAAPVITNFPRIGLGHGVGNTWMASNWSGYAETGSYTGVSGTWTVPTVSGTGSATTYSSAWIGVDGFNNNSLIQTGTEEDYYSGATHYNAWWEILPASETAISSASYPVTPGDRMSASIYETSATTGGGFFHHRGSGLEHVWSINIADATKGWHFSTTQGYNGPGTSAEWVVEAPEVGRSIATLAPYTITPPQGYGDFDGAGVLSTIVSSGNPKYLPAGLNYNNDSGVMIQNNVQVSTPGDPDATVTTANDLNSPNTAFNAAYGAKLPATPAG